MKKYFPFLAFLLFFSITISAQPVKRVLLEEYTGAWCGWCVDGTVIMHEMMEEYPNQVIGICLHNDDAMAIADEATIRSTFTISSFPSGSIDRKPNEGRVPLSRSIWKQYAEELMQSSPLVDVDLYYEIDVDSRQLTATLSCTVLENISNNLTFNVVILEDSVSGTGSGFDQKNFYSNEYGAQGGNDPSHPYWDLPATLYGYQHMNVVKAYLGGPWGISGELANQPYIVGQTYTHQFIYTLPENWKIQHLKFVGMIAIDETGNKEVLNVCYGDTKPPTPPVMELTSTGPDVGVLNEDETINKEFSIKNISSVEHQFRISMIVSDNTPEDWNAELSVNELTVQAGETETFNLSLTAGSNVALSEVKITIESLTDPTAPKTNGSLIGISQNIENFEIISKKEDANSVLPYKTDQNFYFKMSSTEFSKFYDKLPNINNIIWNLGDADGLSSTDVSAVAGMIDKGIDILMLGYKTFSSLNSGNYLDDLGLEYFGYSQENYVEGYKDFAAYLVCVKGDPLTGIMANTVLYLQRQNKEIPVCKITDQANTSPILHFRNPQKIYTNQTDFEEVEGNEAICGFKIIKGDSKIVLIGINPIGLEVEEYRDNLINRPLGWFEGTIGVDEQSTNSGAVSLSVSPNPVGNFVIINYSLQSETSKYCSITLYNTLGQELATVLNDYVNPGCYNIKHNLSEVPDGTCYMVMKCGDKVASAPVIIMK